MDRAIATACFWGTPWRTSFPILYDSGDRRPRDRLGDARRERTVRDDARRGRVTRDRLGDEDCRDEEGLFFLGLSADRSQRREPPCLMTVYVRPSVPFFFDPIVQHVAL